MHDRNGTLLEIGDIVTIECRVSQISSSDAGGYCNATLEYGYDRPHEAFNMTGTISSINSAQTLLIKKVKGK